MTENYPHDYAKSQFQILGPTVELKNIVKPNCSGFHFYSMAGTRRSAIVSPDYIQLQYVIRGPFCDSGVEFHGDLTQIFIYD